MHSETKNTSTNSVSSTCQNCKQNFTIEAEDFNFYRKFDIPAPNQCPPCRLAYLFSFWNYGKFRKATSALSGKSIITTISEEAKFPIYDRNEWVSDAWDPLAYGRDFDFSRSFFEQFKELEASVPHPHQAGVNNTDCQWSDDVWHSKNCYLCRSLLECENLMYSYRVVHCKNCIDITYCYDMEFSYDCLYCFKCYQLKYAFDCRNCVDSAFLFDCRNVQNCFMSWNLRNKQYCILNEQYTKEEYFKKIGEYNLRSFAVVEKLREEFEKIIREKAVHRANFNTQVVNSSGNFLTECKNCFDCMFIEKSQNSRHVWRAIDCEDSIDSVGGMIKNSALSVMSVTLYGTLATSHCSACRYSSYLDYCEDCEYCFGCVGLRKKKYCIFNKQYSEKEYNELMLRITQYMKQTGEWGKFFPLEQAHGAYNLSLAQTLFPRTREQVEEFGGRWYEAKEGDGEGMSAQDLPDDIGDVKEDFTKQAIISSGAKLKYNIAPSELAFYKEHGIPLPRRHFDERTMDRFTVLADAIVPTKSMCYYCKKEIEHYYSPRLRYERIACVDCYQTHIS